MPFGENIGKFLRMQNIFGSMLPKPTDTVNVDDQMVMMPQFPHASSMGGPSQPMAAPSDIRTQMSELYKPETTATDRLNSLLSAMPQRQAPSTMRKIGASVIGLGGGDVEEALFGPYNRQVEDFKTKVGPTMQAAQLERQSNVNERTLAYQTITAQLREEALRAKETNDTRRADIAQQRANVYEFKARNPNVRFDTSGPTVLAMDPVTKKVTDTGVPTGSLTELDKLEFQRETTMQAVGARGDESRETAELRGDIESGLIAERGEEARRTRATPSGAGKGKDELPTQTRVRQFNAARELFNSKPELRPFIKLGNPGSNDFQITPPSEHRLWGHQGPTDEQYKEIQAAIYSGALTRQAPTDKTEPIYKTQRNTRTGATRKVMSTDGGKTWKPAPAGK